MKILLDCRFKKGAGPNVTARYLINDLIRQNTEHEFMILQHKDQDLPEYPGIEKILVPTKSSMLEFLWIQTYLPQFLRRNNFDLYHSLKHLGPLFNSVPTVMYLREVGHFLPGGLEAWKLDPVNRIYWTKLLIWSMRRSTHIIGISQHCKTVIQEKFGIPESKITVNYHGIHQKFKAINNKNDILKVLERYEVSSKYILGVSNIVPHENFDTVVKMLHRLRLQRNEDIKLLIAGDTSGAGSDFFDLIKELGLENDVILPGFVNHDDLVYLYNGSELLLFAPLISALPNPVLEAMACGVPVIASDVGGIPEVTQGAVVLLKDPASVDEMIEAVNQVLDREGLRAELQQKGFERVREFTWEACAARVLKLYQNLQYQMAHQI